MALSIRTKTIAVLSTIALAGTALVGCSSTESEDTTVETVVNPMVQDFDLESHRGGRGETTEESLRAFEKSLDLGVTTLEFDIVMTKDNVPMVWHENEILDTKCEDTAPATENDPQFPYVGKYVKDLDWDQLQTLDCGKQLEGFPDAEVVQGNKLIQLSDVFALTAERHADTVQFNIETKLEAEAPETAAHPQTFVDVIMSEVDKAGVADRVLIQSFDWSSLEILRDARPEIPLVVLWDDTTWIPGSPWTGGIDYDSVNGDIIEAALQLTASVLSPGYAQPYGTTTSDSDYNPISTPEFVKKAHDAGLKIIPWTINDKDVMIEHIKNGVDGIITDYPTLLHSVMEELGLPLPQTYPAS